MCVLMSDMSKTERSELEEKIEDLNDNETSDDIVEKIDH